MRQLEEAPMRDRQTKCPMDALLRLLMGPWTTYILWVLRSTNEPVRFGELKRRVPGISAKVLTERLRLLERAQVIERRHIATIPPQVSYTLAQRGLELNEVLDKLNEVALRWNLVEQMDCIAPEKQDKLDKVDQVA
jgi:DNA-binding HxlR family transcriptional regulator